MCVCVYVRVSCWGSATLATPFALRNWFITSRYKKGSSFEYIFANSLMTESCTSQACCCRILLLLLLLLLMLFGGIVGCWCGEGGGGGGGWGWEEEWAVGVWRRGGNERAL